MFPEMTDEQVDQVIDGIAEFCKEKALTTDVAAQAVDVAATAAH